MKREIAEAPETTRTSCPQFRVLDGRGPGFSCDDSLDEFRPRIRCIPTRRCIPGVHEHNDRLANQVQQLYEGLRKKFLLIAIDMLDFGLGVIIEYWVADSAFVRGVARPLRILLPLRP